MNQLFNEDGIREEFDLYYSQLKQIYESINFEKLRTFSYLRLKNSEKNFIIILLWKLMMIKIRYIK